MSEIKKGALISYAAVAFNAIAGLLYTPWMISCIGADDYGLYTLALSVINFFLIDFGLGEAVSRFLSKYKAEGDRDRAAEFLGVAYKLYFLIALVILIILVIIFLFVDSIYAGLTASQLNTFKLLYAIVAAYSVISFPFLSFDGVLISNELFVALNLCTFLQKVCTVGLIIIALLRGMGVVSLVLVNALTVLAFIVVKLLIIVKKTDTKVTFRTSDKVLVQEVIGFSGWTTVVHLCGRVIFSIMPSILAAVSNTWEVALFGLASSLEGYVYQVANALSNMFMPKVSRIVSHNGSPSELQDLVERVGRIQVFIIGLLFVGFISVGREFVECWVGVEYSMLFPCVILLILPSLLELPQLVANTAVSAVGAMRQKAFAYLAMAAVNLVLGIALSLLFGSLGASVSICVAYFVRTFGMDVLYRKIPSLKIRRLFVKLYGKWFLPAAVTILAGFTFAYFIPLSGWAGLALSALVVGFVYVLLMWKLYLEQDERSLLIKSVKNGR